MNDVELAAKCNEAVSRLNELKINFLALDFDQTILDIHTEGCWKGNATDLSTHVRPLFKQLIHAAVQSGIKVAVVTFSPQVGHVLDVLEITFPEISGSIPIRGDDRSWSYEGNGSKHGKQGHMASAAEELLAMHPNLEISRNSTLLIDDDANNIKIALHDGVRAIWLNPTNSIGLLNDLQMLI